MAVKGVKFAEVRAKALANPAVKAAYDEETRQEELRELLAAMRKRANLTSTEVAARMGVSQPTVSKLERNAANASISTLQRYAAACGMELKLSMG